MCSCTQLLFCYSNLLRPSGVRLQASTLSVKVYLAEDLPQSESREMKGEKEREREREREGEEGEVM